MTYACPSCASTNLRVLLPRVHIVFDDPPGTCGLFDDIPDILPAAPMTCAACDHDGVASDFEADTALGLLREIRRVREGSYSDGSWTDVWARTLRFLDALDHPERE
jgi:hypothetical protein|tara:strand:- start:1271 stop:1588 length:318 start_codon:yes stop_codon:yes gene_type:complete